MSMKTNELKEFLTSIGEIEDLTPKTSPEVRQGDEVNEVKYQTEFIEINRHHNPSLGFKLKKLNDHVQACEIGCGKIVANQVIEYRFVNPDEKRFRIKCTNCGKYKHPERDGIIEQSALVQTVFANYRKSLKDK